MKERQVKKTELLITLKVVFRSRQEQSTGLDWDNEAYKSNPLKVGPPLFWATSLSTPPLPHHPL